MPPVFSQEQLLKNLSSSKSRHRSDLGKAIASGQLSNARGPQAAVPYLLHVKDSSIPNAGKGVFATRKFSVDEPIIMVVGEFVNGPQGTAIEPYVFEMENPYKSDGWGLRCYYDDETNIVKYINTCRNTTRPSNVVVYWHGCLAVLYSKTAIAKGDELLLDYKLS